MFCLLFLVGWHTSAVSLLSVDVIFAQLACPLNDVIFLLRSGVANLSLYKTLLCCYIVDFIGTVTYVVENSA